MSALDELEDFDFDICEEVKKWIEEHPNKSLQELWDICERGDWMLFLLRKKYSVPTSIYREMAWEFAAGVILYVGRNKDVCIETLDVVSQFLDGKCPQEDLMKAAYDAAFAVYGAAVSAYANIIRHFVPKLSEVSK